jgi:hypothetical protein
MGLAPARMSVRKRSTFRGPSLEGREGLKHRSKQGGGGQPRAASNKGPNGRGDTLFLSWEKEKLEESSEKRFILTTFDTTKSSKTPKTHLQNFFLVRLGWAGRKGVCVCVIFFGGIHFFGSPPKF